MILVADSSALIALAACDSLRLLDLLFKKVCVPVEVYNEVAQAGKPFYEVLKGYLHDKVVEIVNPHVIITDFSLGQGEIMAMALYKELRANRLLIDDKRARKIAQLNNIQTIGSIGVLLVAKQEGLITQVHSLLKSIQGSGIYLSSDVYHSALKLAGE